MSRLTQPWVGIVTAVLAALVLLAVWLLAGITPASRPDGLLHAALAAALAAAVYLATRFPVHLRYQVKVEMGTVPLYLMAVVLPPPLAALAAGCGLGAIEWALRRNRGHHPGDIATQAGRWALIEIAGSLVAHVQHPSLSLGYITALVLTAFVLLAGDVLTFPFQISAINGEPVPRLILECARSAGAPEAAQYGVGIAGGILAVVNPVCIFLLLIPLTVVYHVAKRAKELREQTRLQLERLADEVDSRDPFTHEHSKRVTTWTRALLRELDVHGPEAYLVVTAARVHDIGKLSIPTEILHKHEKLTPEEWKVLESHPGLGAEILARYPAFARGVAVVRGHHERWDGKGYPDGLAGSDIPFGARVIAVADSFDAMTSDRPYRDGMPIERAAAILDGGKGTQWDPRIVDAFLRLIEGQTAAAPSPSVLTAAPTG
jgi:hypothetical protein